MTNYQYISFPKGVFPTREEVEKFRSFHDLLDRHVAYGIRNKDKGLAVACERAPFDRLIQFDPEFDAILLCWKVRGASLFEHLDFSKNPDAWKTLPSQSSKGKSAAKTEETPTSYSEEKNLHDKKARFSPWILAEKRLYNKQGKAQKSLASALTKIYLNGRLGEKSVRLANFLP